MRHVDAETLALLALGENDVGPDVTEHLTECAQCRTELEELREIVSAGRCGGPLEQPAPGVWDRVVTELQDPGSEDAVDLSGLPAPVGAEPDRSLATRPAPTVRRGPAPRPGVRSEDTTGPGRGPDTPRTGGDRRRARRRAQLSWIAVAGFAVGVVGTVLVQQLPADDGVVLAQAQLAPLPGWDQTGAAQVLDDDGRRVLTVEVEQGEVDGYQEVWLLDAEVSRLVSLGVLTGTSGTFDVPAELDLGEFVVVDVSREPYDGDPAHSGDSIVRGELTEP